jgi:hypothetical protein
MCSQMFFMTMRVVFVCLFVCVFCFVLFFVCVRSTRLVSKQDRLDLVVTLLAAEEEPSLEQDLRHCDLLETSDG